MQHSSARLSPLKRIRRSLLVVTTLQHVKVTIDAVPLHRWPESGLEHNHFCVMFSVSSLSPTFLSKFSNFLSPKFTGSAPETTIHTEAIVSESEVVSLGGGYAYDHSDEGKRRSLATGIGLFCVAMPNADPAALQAGLNWACGPGHSDCTTIQPGGPCYKQNNIVALASYAYNDYYHRNANTGATCSFNGTAMTTPTDPSSGQCVFAGSSMAGGSNSSTTPAANAPTGLGPLGNGSTVGSPTSILNPLDGADSVLSSARRALCVLLLALPLFFF